MLVSVYLSGFAVRRSKFNTTRYSDYKVKIVFAYLHIGRTLKSDITHQNYLYTAFVDIIEFKYEN